MSKSDSKQSIEELKVRYEDLKSQKVKFETQRDAAKEELENLKQQAKELYGSDDIPTLEKLLSDMKEENEKRRANYQTALDQIDERLAQVESDFESEPVDA